MKQNLIDYNKRVSNKSKKVLKRRKANKIAKRMRIFNLKRAS